MNITKSAENEELIDRYLNNRLSDEERTAFEIRFMSEPELLEQLQLADAFKQGLSTHQQELTGPAKPTVLSFGSWLRQPLSIAASLLVAVLGMQAFYTGNQADKSSLNALPIATVVLLENTRGTAGLQVDGIAPYLFQIDAGLGTLAQSFTVSLRNPDTSALILEQSGLQQDANGWIRVVINNTLSGDYTVELSWTDTQGARQTRSFPLTASNQVPAP